MNHQKINQPYVLLWVTTIIFFPLILSTCGSVDGPTPPCQDYGLVPTNSYWEPAWHPTGEVIGFNHMPLVEITYPNDDKCYGIQHFDSDSLGFWIIHPDGSQMHRIYDHFLQTPQWSPDGQWIAFVDGAQIYKMRFTGDGFDTTSITQLTTQGRNFFPSWSPSGDRLVYDSDVNSETGLKYLWIMNNDGTLKHRVMEQPSRMPAWSPDGETIVYTAYLDSGSRELFRMDTAGDNVVRLTNNSADDRFPKYSPDGSHIAFLSDGKLCCITAMGGDFHQLSYDDVQSYSFAWNPNGSKLVYTKYSPHDWTYSNSTLWLHDYPGGPVQQLTYNP